MEQKSLTFLRSFITYVIAIFGLEFFPNGLMLFVQKSLDTMILLYGYSVGVGVVIALLLCVQTRRAACVDEGAALFTCAGASLGTLILLPELYKLTSLGELQGYIATNTCVHPCGEVMLNLWAISVCLGVCLGMIVLSVGTLLRHPQVRKEKS